jgi:hypothetical protein
MANKTIILNTTTFKDFGELFRHLRTPAMRALVSVGQAETIADIADANLPGDVKLEQRTPKGTIYVHIEDDYAGAVNQAGKYIHPSAAQPSKHFLSANDLPRVRVRRLVR